MADRPIRACRSRCRVLRIAICVTALGLVAFLGWLIFGLPSENTIGQAIQQVGGSVEYADTRPSALRWLLSEDSGRVVDSVLIQRDRPSDLPSDGLSILGHTRQMRCFALKNMTYSDQEVTFLSQTHSLVMLELHGQRITSKSLLASLGNQELQNLCVDFSSVDDEGVSRLDALASLAAVNLQGTRVTDASMASLARLPKLTHLYLKETAISDRGVEALARSTSLEYLNLSGTAIGDASLKALAKIRTLRGLSIDGAKVSDEACRDFMLARPDVSLKR